MSCQLSNCDNMTKMLIGHKKIICQHMVFDMEIGELTRKARLHANGNETDPQK